MVKLTITRYCLDTVMHLFPSGKLYIFVYIFSEIEFHVAQFVLEFRMDQRLVLNS